MYEDLINSLIEEYGDENQYIKSDKIETILDRLDDDFTEEEIKEIMTAINKHNIAVYNHLKTLVAKSKKIEELKKNNIERNVTKETKCNTTLEYTARPSLEEVIDISYYVEQINSILLGDDYSSDKLRKILPNAYNSDYAALIKLIYLHYKKEQIKAIKEKKDESNSDIFDLYVEEEEKLATLCSDIKEYLLYLEETPRDDILIEEVKIVFDPDTIYSDLDQLTRETLGLLYDAIISLKRNVIKGAKAFHNDRIKKRINEIKISHLRACFDWIDNNTVAIYYVFEKHTQNNKYYRETLENRLVDFYGKRDYWLAPYKNPETKEQAINDSEVLYTDVMNNIKNNMNRGSGSPCNH